MSEEIENILWTLDFYCVVSAKNGDTGVLLYAGMAISALQGTSVVVGKKRRVFS